MTDDEPGFSTLSIHAGARPDPTTGARVTPIYQTTAFVFDDVDHAAVAVRAAGVRQHLHPHHQPDDRRARGARRRAGGRAGGARRRLRPRRAGGGVPRADAAWRRIRRLDKALRRFDQPVRPRLQEFRLARSNGPIRTISTPSRRRSAKRPRRSSSSSIANPGGVVTDIEAIAGVAKAAKVPLIVDNTLATPYLIRPIDHGADIVVHSATKYLCGHGNSMGGVIVDCGSFDWIGDPRYPMLSAPRPEYNGMTLAETFGNFAFAMSLPRAVLTRSRPGDLAVQFVPDPDRDRDAVAAHAAPLRQRAGGRQASGRAR